MNRGPSSVSGAEIFSYPILSRFGEEDATWKRIKKDILLFIFFFFLGSLIVARIL